MLILEKLERFSVSLGDLACGVLSLFIIAFLIITMFYILVKQDNECALLTGTFSLVALGLVTIICIYVTHMYKWIIIDIIFLILSIIATLICSNPKK